MKKKYEVIWIDDEWEKMDAFKEECEVIHQIYLHPFRTQKAGMDEFDKNPKIWDAIILDAKMFDESENEVPKLDGLRKAVQHINEKSLLRKVPYFISTGQPDLMDNETFEQAFGTFYIKERDDKKLIEDLKTIASKSTRFQVKTYYLDALDQIVFLDTWCCEKILDILEAMHFPEKTIDPLLYYNPLRKALEYVFRAANKVGVIPDDFFSGGMVNLNQCFMFLIGREARVLGYRYGDSGEGIVPRHIHDMMSLIINLGNYGSHSIEQSHPTELSEYEVQKYDKQINAQGVNSKLLIFSIALQFCEIVKWMNHYITEHPNKEENLKKCVKLNMQSTENKERVLELVGVIELHDGLCHIGNNFSVYLRRKELIGKRVRIAKYTPNTSTKSKEKYPYFVHDNDIQVLEDTENGSK